MASAAASSIGCSTGRRLLPEHVRQRVHRPRCPRDQSPRINRAQEAQAAGYLKSRDLLQTLAAGSADLLELPEKM